jgi:hypothetical protein
MKSTRLSVLADFDTGHMPAALSSGVIALDAGFSATYEDATVECLLGMRLIVRSTASGAAVRGGQSGR